MSDPTPLSPAATTVFQAELHQLQIITYVATATLGVSNIDSTLVDHADSRKTDVYLGHLQ